MEAVLKLLQNRVSVVESVRQQEGSQGRSPSTSLQWKSEESARIQTVPLSALNVQGLVRRNFEFNEKRHIFGEKQITGERKKCEICHDVTGDSG